MSLLVCYCIFIPTSTHPVKKHEQALTYWKHTWRSLTDFLFSALAVLQQVTQCERIPEKLKRQHCSQCLTHTTSLFCYFYTKWIHWYCRYMFWDILSLKQGRGSSTLQGNVLEEGIQTHPWRVPYWLLSFILYRKYQSSYPRLSCYVVHTMWEFLEKQLKGPLAVDWGVQSDLEHGGFEAPPQHGSSQAPERSSGFYFPPQPQAVLPTWHDDIRKSQFSCNCQSPIKNHGIFSPDLFHVSTKKLQRNNQTWKKTKPFS